MQLRSILLLFINLKRHWQKGMCCRKTTFETRKCSEKLESYFAGSIFFRCSQSLTHTHIHTRHLTVRRGREEETENFEGGSSWSWGRCSGAVAVAITISVAVAASADAIVIELTSSGRRRPPSRFYHSPTTHTHTYFRIHGMCADWNLRV